MTYKVTDADGDEDSLSFTITITSAVDYLIGGIMVWGLGWNARPDGAYSTECTPHYWHADTREFLYQGEGVYPRDEVDQFIRSANDTCEASIPEGAVCHSQYFQGGCIGGHCYGQCAALVITKKHRYPSDREFCFVKGWATDIRDGDATATLADIKRELEQASYCAETDCEIAYEACIGRW